MTDITTDGTYQVLARKYRPQSFEDLIGHEAMVRTLRNAFSTGRIAHAWVLTGVRGVGKTTTARILARALNYVGPDGQDDGPSIDMPVEGTHCRAIAESRHPDVLEMDAASRTGVGDIRELIEGVRYAPVEARYKVYIIDEVHMLSTQAFNALLKTLEEPPPHVKFIFATTEIRKLPVTVLSRCQRFDLRRIELDVLTAHLDKIAGLEGGAVALEGLQMIARAAEGSVRDALSILDQALLQHQGGDAVGPDAIRDMLGLADRSQVWQLLKAALAGDGKTVLSLFRGQYDAGADPAIILKDLLEVVHLATRVKAAGPEAAAQGAAGEEDAARAIEIADGLQLNGLTRAWSLLMKGLSDVQIAPDPASAAEIALIRIVYAVDLPTPDEALRALKSRGGPQAMAGTGAQAGAGAGTGTGIGAEVGTGAPGHHAHAGPRGAQTTAIGAAQNAPAMAPQTSPHPRAQAANLPQPQSFEEVVRLAEQHRDLKLKVELESFVHLISFECGKIRLRLAADAPDTLAGRLTQCLLDWTGRRWTISVEQGEKGAETLRDVRNAEVMGHSLVKEALRVFPGAEIMAIREVKTDGEDNENVLFLDPEDEDKE